MSKPLTAKQPTECVSKPPIMDAQDSKLQKSAPDLIHEFAAALPKLLLYKAVKTSVVDRLTALLEPFKEDPQLLDPYLSNIVTTLSSAFLPLLRDIPDIKDQDLIEWFVYSKTIPLWRAICLLLSTLCKVRGYKTITRFFDNRPQYLEPMLDALDTCVEVEKPNQHLDHEKYIILLNHEAEPRLPDNLPFIAWRATKLSVSELTSPTKEGHPARLLLIRTILRHDLRQYGMLEILLDWALSDLRVPPILAPIFSRNAKEYVHIGLLSFITGLLASADTSVIAPFLIKIYDSMRQINYEAKSVGKSIASSALKRKLVIKILRHVSAHFLKPNFPSYHRGDYLADIADKAVSETINHLIDSLDDIDTLVRNAASKSLSLLAAKLSPDEAAQLVDEVLRYMDMDMLYFDPVTGNPVPNTETNPKNYLKLKRSFSEVNPFLWHGHVMTFSQLLLHRSAPEYKLPHILTALISGLHFEQRSTVGTLIGSNVRDAACLGIWALARRYTTQQLLAINIETNKKGQDLDRPMSTLQLLANVLIVTATLDPTGNIRRGAAAALQELIGRHPNTIDKGIEVVQIVDYHAVARRSMALTSVSFTAASLSDFYWTAILDGLLGWRGVESPDAASRRGTALTIGKLSTLHFSIVLQRTRQLLRTVNMSQVRVVERLHALILSLAELVERLDSQDELETHENLATDGAFGRLCGDLPSSQRKDGLKGSNSPLIDEAISSLTSAIGRRAQGPSSTIQLFLLKTLQADLPRRVEEIQRSLRSDRESVIDQGCQALDAVFFAFDIRFRDYLIQGWLSSVNGSKYSSNTYGAIMALGIAYRHIRHRNPGLGNTIRDALLSQTEGKDYMTEVWALRSLASSALVEEGLHPTTIDALHRCLGDQTKDHRGNVGSHVRIEAIKVVEAILKRKPSSDPPGIRYPPGIEKLLSKVFGLAVEKLDSVRFQAYNSIKRVQFDDDVFSKFAFTVNDTGTEAYFRQFLSLTAVSVLQHDILEEIVLSMTSGGRSLLHASRTAFATHTNSIAPSELDVLCTTLLNILKANAEAECNGGSDRLLVPVMEVWGFLFEIGVLERLEANEMDKYLPLVNLLRAQSGATNPEHTAPRRKINVPRINAGIVIYSGILSSNNFKHSYDAARFGLTRLLVHSYPLQRSGAADALFLHFEDISLLKTFNFMEQKATLVEIEAIRAAKQYHHD